jgi:hypothetical protein
MVNHDILDPRFAMKAMRDSGYKNTAYAIAELIDNAVQANATHIDVLCKEIDVQRESNARRMIEQIAVCDNGSGMDKDQLWRSLQFGQGSRLDDRRGIGRFGMGLPNSSMSQAKRVDVWTWQHGIDSAIHTYIDLEDVETGNLRQVPEPTAVPVPIVWSQAASRIDQSGTLIVWSKVDRATWSTAAGFFRNSENLIGRTYRRFLVDQRVQIRIASFLNSNKTCEIDALIRPNDPLYLMANTSCPEPWADTAMFEPYGELNNFSNHFDVRFNGATHRVTVRLTHAKKAARSGHNPGGLPHGKHAAKNIGVSIMRADRELELQTGWTISHDPVERFWGAEVDFPPSLDELFGVTNDKQHARFFADLAGTDDKLEDYEGYATFHELMEALRNDGNPRFHMLEIRNYLIRNIRAMRNRLSENTRGSRGAKRHNGDTPEQKGTEATRQRQSEGFRGASDAGETEPAESRRDQIIAGLLDGGADQEDAEQGADLLIANQSKFYFQHSAIDSASFFSVRHLGGAIVVSLNTTHPAYQHLIALLEDAPADDNIEALRARMTKCHDGLKLLLEAWARFEDELPPAKRMAAQDIRNDWGRVARQFMVV